MKVKSRPRQPDKKGKQYSGAPSWSDPAFRELADNIIDGVYCIKTDGYFAFINRVIRERYGISPDKIHATHFLDVVHPTYHDLASKNFQRVMSGKDGIPYELRYEGADGKEKFLEVLSKPIRNDGKVVGLIGISRDVTERKRAEEALKDSEERFSVTFRVNPAPITISTVDDGVILDVNDQWLSMIGYARDEMIGQETVSLPIWLDYEARASFVRKFLKEGFLRGESVQLRTKSGEIRDTLWSAELIKYGGREVVMSLLYDITDRKLAEQALQESERKYRLLFDNAIEGIYQVSPEGRFISANPAAARILGYESPEELIDTIKDIGSQIYAYPEDRNKATELMREHGFIKDFEARCRHKTGSIVWVSFNATLVRDDQGNILYHEGTSQDITERKRAEEVLRERDIQLNKLSFWVPGMIYQFTKRTDGTYCMPFSTEAIKDIFGCSPQDVCEDFSPIAKVILPEDLDKVFDSIEYSAKHLNVWTCEYRVQSPGESIRWMLGNSTPEKLADGSITWYGFNTDITDRKHAEEELAKYRKGLEQLVAERTQNLEDKTKALEELNISLKVLLRYREEDRKELEDRFVMNIKKLIMPFAEKMKSTRLDERQLAYLSIIEKHLNDMTSSLTKRMHQLNFTPREVEVASLLNEGKTTKEIAEIIGIATSSINTHRNQIRKKLGIIKKKVNLRSHLQSFD